MPTVPYSIKPVEQVHSAQSSISDQKMKGEFHQLSTKS